MTSKRILSNSSSIKRNPIIQEFSPRSPRNRNFFSFLELQILRYSTKKSLKKKIKKNHFSFFRTQNSLFFNKKNYLFFNEKVFKKKKKSRNTIFHFLELKILCSSTKFFFKKFKKYHFSFLRTQNSFFFNESLKKKKKI